MEKLNEIISPVDSKCTSKASIKNDNDNAKLCRSTISENINNLNTVKGNNKKFANKLLNSFEHVLIYEQESLKRKALLSIPTERLKSDAKNKYDSYKAITLEKLPYDFNDFLLIELLAWFKNEFFKWINQPDCDYCNSNEKMTFLHNDFPNLNEKIWMANNVEVYKYLLNFLKATRLFLIY